MRCAAERWQAIISRCWHSMSLARRQHGRDADISPPNQGFAFKGAALKPQPHAPSVRSLSRGGIHSTRRIAPCTCRHRQRSVYHRVGVHGGEPSTHCSWRPKRVLLRAAIAESTHSHVDPSVTRAPMPTQSSFAVRSPSQDSSIVKYCLTSSAYTTVESLTFPNSPFPHTHHALVQHVCPLTCS